MATIGSTGNTQLRALAQQLIQAERKPLLGFQARKTEYEAKVRNYRTLASKLSELRALARTFASETSSNPIRTIKAYGSDDAVLGVAVTSGAQPGAHSVKIHQLAQRHTIASATMVEDGGALAASGALVGGRLSMRVKAGGEDVDFAVQVDEGATDGAVLRAIAQGAVDVGLSATVVQSSPQEVRLLLQASGSGADARIAEVLDLEGSAMSAVGLAGVEDAGSSHPATIQEGKDSLIELDGLSIRATSNELVNVLPGITLTLHATTEDARTVRAERDLDAVVKKISDFMAKYNETLDQVRSLTAASDSSGSNRGPLTGEVTVQKLRSELRGAVTATVSSVPEDSLRTLSQVGIVADREGHLSLRDPSSLQKALAETPEAVEALMNGEDGVATRLSDLMDRYAKTGGLVSLQQDALSARIRSVDSRIRKEQEALAKREDSVLSQLAQIEAGLGELTRQQSYLSGLLGSSDSLFA